MQKCPIAFEITIISTKNVHLVMLCRYIYSIVFVFGYPNSILLVKAKTSFKSGTQK